MKFAFVLYVAFFDVNGNVVSKEKVNDVVYQDQFECMVAKAHHRDDILVKFSCEKIKK